MAKKTAKTNEPFSVKDFKMWLLGLTEFQEAGWTPNAKQWKTILEKVEMLDDSVQYVQVSQQESTRPIAANNGPQVVTKEHDPMQVHAFDISNMGVPGTPPDQRFLDEPRKPSYGTPTQTTGDTGIVSIDITKPGSFI